MKSDSKSGLSMKGIITILSIVMLLTSSTQLLFTNNKVQKDNEENTHILEETKIAKTEEFNRNINVTNRGNVQRNKEISKQKILENEKEYITINEINISKEMDLSQRCGISKEDFIYLIKNLEQDTSGFFYENSSLIYDLCEKYELNEIFFCGLIAGEAGWNIAKSHRDSCNYISMLSKGKLIKYSSQEEGLEAAAKLLHNSYLTEGGSFYKGSTLYSVQKTFCPDSKTWVDLIYGCMEQIIK